MSTRGRRDVDAKDTKINVCVFVFDMIYLNGESMIDVQLVNDGAVGSFNLSLAPQVSAAINFWR